MSLIFTVQNYILQTHLFSQNDKVILSLSGGPDSLFLLHCLLGFLDKKNILLVHFDHFLRTTSQKEADFVKKKAKDLKIKLIVINIPVKEYAKKHKLSLETAARNLRRNNLIKIAKEKKIKYILTAHQLDDACETFMHRLIRGTRSNFSSIQTKVEFAPNIFFVRPLLNISKAQILAYLDENNIKFLLDETNQENKFTRNIIRNKLLPLVKALNPSYQNNWQELFNYFNEEQDFLNDFCKPYFKNAKISNDEAIIDMKILKNAHPFIQKRIIFLLIKSLLGEENNLENKHIQLLFQKVQNKKNTIIDLCQGIRGRISYNNLIIEKKKTESKDFYYEIKKIPFELKVESINKIITFNLIKKNSQEFINSKNIFYLDFAQIKNYLPIIIRNRKSGDFFQSLGSSYKKTIKKYFIDEKIPVYERNSVPLLFINNSLVCILGFQASELYKISKNTKKILKIEIA